MSLPVNVPNLDTLATDLRRGRISSEELVSACLGRIEEDRELNAVVEIDADAAIRSARDADRHLRETGPDTGPLCGIPVTVKRTFEVSGFTHSEHDVESGFPAGLPACRDASAVARLRAAGAIVLGRTNAPPRAADIDTWHPRFGRTAHPLGAHLSPGGSSGGSAAAVAAMHTMLDLASDDAGSARIPAHACGVFTLRPTLGSVSTVGHVPGPVTEFDGREMLTACPVARSAEDLGTAWRVLGPRREGREDPGPPGPQPVAAVLADGAAPMAAEVADSLGAAVDHLQATGQRVDAAKLPVDLAENWLLCQQLLYAETAQEAAPAVTDVPSAGAPPIEIAWWCAGLTHRAWRRLRSERARIQLRWQQFFTRYPALILPVMGRTALPPRDVRVPLLADDIRVGDIDVPTFSLSVWCALASVAGLPAASMPVRSLGPTLPVGLQVIAGHGQEAALLRLVRRWAPIVSPAGEDG